MRLPFKMADRRRRRRNSSNTESECSEGEDTAELKEVKPAKKESECDSEVTQGEDDTSEYDSTTEGYDEDETEDEVTEDVEDDVIVEDGEEDDWIEQERQSGDGEEEPNNSKNLDDDEDKKNPAYIPRKGAFYEHDTRLGDEVKEVKEELVPKKKLWTDVGKWDHDRYNPEQQRPKSREEIIAIYGYDIRSREKPPESFPRGTKTQRRRQGRRKQLGDFMSPGDGKSYDRPSRGRGAFSRGISWRGSPKGRGWQSSRRTTAEAGSERGGRSYSDFKNARNDAVKYSADIYNAESRSRTGGSVSRQWSGTKNSGNKTKVSEERQHLQEDSLPNPPDVVPAGHAYSSIKLEQSADQQQSRSRYKQSVSSAQNYAIKSSHNRDSRSKGSQSHAQSTEIVKSNKNVHRAPLDDKSPVNSLGQNTAAQDSGVLSIYPPVTTQVIATTDKSVTSSTSNQGSVDESSLIPPLTKPHRSTTTTTTQAKLAETTQGKGKQADSTRTKRYSTQRQRPPQEMSGYVQENTRETSITQPAIPTQSAQIGHSQGPICTPVPQYYGQIYARPPAVFRQANPVSSQSPPHTLSFPQPPVIQPPLQAVPFSMPASSHVQSPPRLHLGPESTVATASMTAAVAPNGGQTMLQGPFVPAPVMNYGPPGQQPPQAPPSHYQMTGHVPIQFPAPTQGPEPIQIHGGTTYFSHEAPAFRTGTTYFSPEAQQASPSRSAVTRRPKAAIPIINPQDLSSTGTEQDAAQDGEQYEKYMDEQLELAQSNELGEFNYKPKENHLEEESQNTVNQDADSPSETAGKSESSNQATEHPSSHTTSTGLQQASSQPNGTVTIGDSGSVALDAATSECANTHSANDKQREEDVSTQDSSLVTGDNEGCSQVDNVEKTSAETRSNPVPQDSDGIATTAHLASNSSEITTHNQSDLGHNDEHTVTDGTEGNEEKCSPDVEAEEPCSKEGSVTTCTNTEKEQEDTKSILSCQLINSQSKEQIMTEIKLVYTEAPES